jgi:hypothetical protein
VSDVIGYLFFGFGVVGWIAMFFTVPEVAVSRILVKMLLSLISVREEAMKKLMSCLKTKHPLDSLPRPRQRHNWRRRNLTLLRFTKRLLDSAPSLEVELVV